jgi:quinol monooxygenase YgiN
MAAQPIVFISRFDMKPGHTAAMRALWDSVAPELEASRPATAAYLAYLDEAGDRLTIVHVFPDAAAFAAHAVGAGERSRAAFEHVVPAGWEVYGSAEAANLEELRSAAERFDVPLQVHPGALGGFLRMADRGAG